VGIFPVNKLSERSIVCSFDNFPSSVGIGPVMSLLCRSLSTINAYVRHTCTKILSLSLLSMLEINLQSLETCQVANTWGKCAM